MPKFHIDAKTPEADLLPTAPKATKSVPVYLGDDLSRVPELRFEAPPAKSRSTEEWVKHTAHALAKADHLNGRKHDGFVRALIRERGDLVGLPFLLGDDCRKSGRGKAFKKTATLIRSTGFKQEEVVALFVPFAMPKEWMEREFGDDGYTDASVAALAQVLGGDPSQSRKRVVGIQSTIPRTEATQQIARVAVFDPDKGVRDAAVEVLAVRRERDYTDVLVQALRYPWPSVARHAAEAIVKLERKDLMPELVALLDEPDPRLPRTEKSEDKPVSITRELVRVNHHKSCLLCHAPADPETPLPDVLTAEVPIPSEALPAPTTYGERSRGLLVRIDTAYLRQDFSVLQAVKNADPWPEMQRFDFLVRKRPLSDAEADDLRTRLETKEPGELSPYQRAAVGALREMTGRDFEAKAEPWRKLLKLAAKKES